MALVFSLYLPVAAQEDTVMLQVDRAKNEEEQIAILNKASSQLKDADTKKSLAYASKALQLARDINNLSGIAQALLNMGRCHTRQGNHEEAMRNYFKALDISQKIADDKLVAQTLKVIGNGYYFKSDFKSALEYYKKSLKINLKTKDEENGADLQNNIALIFINEKELDSAELYLSDAATAYERLNRPAKLANTLLNLGEVKDAEQKFSEALEYFSKSLALNRSLNLDLPVGFVLNSMSGVMISQGKLNQAIDLCQQALLIANKQHFQTLKQNCYKNLFQAHKKLGNLSSALDYHERLLAINDSIYNQEKDRQIEELRTKYETERVERQNEALTQEAVLKQKQLSTTRTYLIISIVLALLTSGLAFYSYRAWQQNKEANKLIENQNLEIKAQAEELMLANNEIATINENLEMLVKQKTSTIVTQNQTLLSYTFQNAHNVRAPLARLMGLINLIRLGNSKQEELEFLLAEMEKASTELDRVLKEMNETLQSGITGADSNA